MIIISKQRWDALEEKMAGVIASFGFSDQDQQVTIDRTEAVMTAVYNWLTTSAAVISK